MALARFILRNSAAYVKIKKCKNTPDLLRMPTIQHAQTSPFFEIARVLVRFDHVARVVINANHKRSGLQTHIATTESVCCACR